MTYALTLTPERNFVETKVAYLDESDNFCPGHFGLRVKGHPLAYQRHRKVLRKFRLGDDWSNPTPRCCGQMMWVSGIGETLARVI